MEIIQNSKEDAHEMAALECCWPPGSQNWESPE